MLQKPQVLKLLCMEVFYKVQIYIKMSDKTSSLYRNQRFIKSPI